MISLEDLLIIVLLVISTVASITIFIPLYQIKSFFQISEDISNYETIKSGDIKVISSLYACLENKNDEQIMINNFHFKRKNMGYWYKIFLVLFIPLIIYMTLKCDLSRNIQSFLIFFSLGTVISVLLSFYFIICKTRGVNHIELRNLFGIVLPIFIQSFLIIFITLTILMLLLYLYILVDKYAAIELLDKVTPNISSSEMTDSIYGIKFSLSSLFFTLSIGSTVIFSIINHYLIDKKRIEEELKTKLEVYKKWYNKYENKEKTVLCLRVNDALNVDKLNKFNYAMAELRSDLNVYSIKKLRNRTQRYEFFIYLIIFSYFGGVFTIFVPVDFLNIIFSFFCLMCGISIALAYLIFMDYNTNNAIPK